MLRVRQSGGGGDCDRLSGPVLGGLREQRGADQNWSILLIVATFHPCPWFPTVTSDNLRIPQIFLWLSGKWSNRFCCDSFQKQWLIYMWCLLCWNRKLIIWSSSFDTLQMVPVCFLYISQFSKKWNCWQPLCDWRSIREWISECDLITKC